MAGDEGIRVIFSGDASGVASASKKGAAALKGFAKEAGLSTSAVGSFNRSLGDMKTPASAAASVADDLANSLAGIHPVVGLVVSGLALYVKEQILANQKAKESAKVFDNLRKTFGDVGGMSLEAAKSKLEEYSKTVEGVVKKNAEELANVTALVGRLKESNTTRKESVSIIKELQKIAPDYFGKLNAEKASVKEVTLAYQAYNREIVKTIETQIRLADLSGIIKERLDFERQNQQASEFVNNLLAQGKTLNEIANAVNAQYGGADKLVMNAAKANKLLTKEQENQVIQSDAIRGSVLNIVGLLRKEKEVLDDINKVPLKKLGIDFEKAKIEKIEVPEINLRAARVGLTFSEMLVEKSTLNDRFDIAGLIDTGKIPAPSLPALQLPEPDPEQIKRIQTILRDLAGFFQEVGTQITASLGNAFAGLFDSIMSGSQSAFQAFAVALGNIIKKLLATAAAAAVLTFILGPLGLVKGAPGAGALKGFDAFRKIFSSIGGFAEGGVVDGPTSGYPAILHGKEVVAPFDKFMSLMQGAQNGGDGRLSMEVRGDKLLFAVNRAQRGANTIR